jgi:signal peptidase I
VSDPNPPNHDDLLAQLRRAVERSDPSADDTDEAPPAEVEDAPSDAPAPAPGQSSEPRPFDRWRTEAPEEEPDPTVTGPEPEPVVTEPSLRDPEPVVTEPEPVAPEPVVIEPEPVAPEPDPVVNEREPVMVEPEPTIIEPQPVAPEPEPVLVEPEPVVPEPARADHVEPDGQDGEEVLVEEEGSSRRRSVQSAMEWAAVIVGALVVALVVKTFLFQAFYIPSGSMEPTLQKGDRVLVNKVSYDLHDVHRGDVIVFELDDDDVAEDGIRDLIKRVIGLPGDTIESREGVVYVNDRPLTEPYLADGMVTGDPEDSQNPPIDRQTVPEGHVFVLGDNRSNSADSRFEERGPIPIDSIVGRAFVLVWPPRDLAGL